MSDRPIIFSTPMVKALLAGRKTQTRRKVFFPRRADLLWVKETFRHDDFSLDDIIYKADIPDDVLKDADLVRWRPSIFMPRKRSRITLVVDDIRFQRLQSISEADALAEGLIAESSAYRVPGTEMWGSTPQLAFRLLWTELHGPEAWDINPEVVALTFTVHCCNIDALPQARAA